MHEDVDDAHHDEPYEHHKQDRAHSGKVFTSHVAIGGHDTKGACGDKEGLHYGCTAVDKEYGGEGDACEQRIEVEQECRCRGLHLVDACREHQHHGKLGDDESPHHPAVLHHGYNECLVAGHQHRDDGCEQQAQCHLAKHTAHDFAHIGAQRHLVFKGRSASVAVCGTPVAILVVHVVVFVHNFMF